MDEWSRFWLSLCTDFGEAPSSPSSFGLELWSCPILLIITRNKRDYQLRSELEFYEYDSTRLSNFLTPWPTKSRSSPILRRHLSCRLPKQSF